MMTFEELMTVDLPPTVTEECAARSYMRAGAFGKRRADGLCIVCREPLPTRRFRYCSDECGRWFSDNHAWTQAQAAAIKHNLQFNGLDIVLHIHYEAVPASHYNGGRAAVDYDVPRRVGCCSRCQEPECYGDEPARLKLDRRLEVDHIIPLNGGYRAKTCANHQTNLRVVCHACHLVLTAEQRAQGLIGKRAFTNRP